MVSSNLDETRQLGRFLSACGGNWRNAVFICGADENERYLMTADRDGVPVLIELGSFCRQTGISVDTDECCARMGQDVFETVFAQYLLWRLPSRREHSLDALCKPDDGGREAGTA